LRPEVQNEVRLTNTQPKDVQTLREEAKRRCDAIARKMKERYDKNRKEAVRYKEGDIVLVKRTLLVKGLSSGKLVPKYIGPVKIIAVLGNDRYRVASFSKDRRRFKGVVASDRLKLFVPQDAEIE
jgi:translation initiation factor IF-1